MNKKVSMVIIALLLITQMMQGWMFTPTMHAQDDMTAIVTMDTASEEGSVEPVAGNGDNGVSMDSPESNESAEVIKENLITSVQMYNQIPEYDGNGNMNIKGERIEDIRPSVKDEVAVVFTWGLPNDTHTYSDGSTFTFRLPDKFKIGSQLKGNLDGGVGEYVVNPDGEITFTFNDRIVGEKLEGNFYVWIKFDESKMDGGLKQPIDFSSVGQGIINVHFLNTAIDKLTKSGIANKNNFNSDEIEWTVDFNQGEKGINNTVLNDTLAAGPLKGNIEIRELHIQLDGSVKEGSTVRTETQFPIALGNIDKAYRVKYTTSIKAPTTAPFTNVLYENKVVLTGDQSEHDETDIGSVRVSFNEPLKKSGQESAYNPVTQTITWKVQYNYNQQGIIQANAWIEDRYDTTKHELVDGSVKVHQVDIDGDGKPAGTTLVNSNEYTLTGVGTGFDDGFKLQFKNDITKAYEIEYQTKTINRVYTDATVTNTVNMYDGTEKKAKRTFRKSFLRKVFKVKILIPRRSSGRLF
ncbi:collagen binding domain-containing protein [Paenibacillus sp. 1A_MP2]|uniref:collagen binding domain-containing protein n=1 Tax=Paenibacillus sp. 1A_MP2 TaxID=3457495 RepID=UPI003FCEC3D7